MGIGGALTRAGGSAFDSAQCLPIVHSLHCTDRLRAARQARRAIGALCHDAGVSVNMSLRPGLRSEKVVV